MVHPNRKEIDKKRVDEILDGKGVYCKRIDQLVQIISNKDNMIKNLEAEIKAKDERIIVLREQIKEINNAKRK